VLDNLTMVRVDPVTTYSNSVGQVTAPQRRTLAWVAGEPAA